MKEEYTLAELKEFRNEFLESLYDLIISNKDNDAIKWALDRAVSEFVLAIQKLLDGEFEISKEHEKE